jgi:hypothetical protein
MVRAGLPHLPCNPPPPPLLPRPLLLPQRLAQAVLQVLPLLPPLLVLLVLPLLLLFQQPHRHDLCRTRLLPVPSCLPPP